jgi:hypothetical protein
MKPKDPSDPNSPLYPADEDGNPTTVYTQPNLVQRLVSPTARTFAGENAQFGSTGAKAKAAQDIQLANAKSIAALQPPVNNPNTASFPDDSGAALNAWSGQAVDPYFAPSNSHSQLLGQGADNTGTVMNTGGTEATTANTSAGTQLSATQAAAARQPNVNKLGDINTNLALGQGEFDLNNLSQEHKVYLADQTNRLSKALNVDPILIRNAQVKAMGVNNRLNTDEETADMVSKQQNSYAAFQLKEQNLTQSNQRLQDIRDNANLRVMPRPGYNEPFVTKVGLNGTTNVSGVNPDYANMMQMMNAKGGMGGNSGTTGPKGTQLDLSPINQETPPETYNPQTIGNQSTQSGPSSDFLENSQDYKTSSIAPGLMINPKNQRAVYNGQDITEQINSNPGLLSQVRQELEKQQNSDDKDQQNVLNSKHTIEMQALKDKQAALAKQHVNSSRLGAFFNSSVNNTEDDNPSWATSYKNPLVGIPEAAGQVSVPLTQHFIGGSKKLIGLGKDAYNYFLGE